MIGTKLRKLATPLTIGAFALSAVSGLMMFFHLNSGLVKSMHEWGSWCLVIGGLLHVIASWKPFIQYFHKPAAKIIMTVFALLILTFFIPLGGSTETRNGDRRLPPGLLSRVLSQASFSAVASVAQHSPDELLKQLQSKGLVVKDQETTIREIAADNNRKEAEILNLIF